MDHKLHERVAKKYRGYAINDMESYLTCRRFIAAGRCVEHYESLKRYYRRAFLNAPFRKAK